MFLSKLIMYITLIQVTVREKEFLVKALAQDRNSFSPTMICIRVMYFNCDFTKVPIPIISIPTRRKELCIVK